MFSLLATLIAQVEPAQYGPLALVIGLVTAILTAFGAFYARIIRPDVEENRKALQNGKDQAEACERTVAKCAEILKSAEICARILAHVLQNEELIREIRDAKPQIADGVRN